MDRLPVEPTVAAGAVPEAQLVAALASLTAQISVPYAEAATFMLANLERASAMARHRFGLALPAARPVQIQVIEATPDVLSQVPEAARFHGP